MKSTALYTIRRVMVRNWSIQAGFGLLLVVLSGLTYYLTPVRWPEPTQNGAAVLAAVLFTSGLYLIISAALQWTGRQNCLWRELQRDRRKIVWVYAYVAANRPYGVQVLNIASIHFYTQEGEHHSLSVPVKKQMEIMVLLNGLLPHATFGHSLEKEQLYQANPELLRRDTAA